MRPPKWYLDATQNVDFILCRGYEFTLPATAGLRIFASIIMLTKNNPMNS